MTRLPDGRPLEGRQVRLSLVTEDDLGELAAIVTDPAIYSAGFVMRRRPTTMAEALAAARTQYLDVPSFDGQGHGRVAYAVRLTTDSELGRAGEVIGTSSLGEAVLTHERLHLGWTMYHPRAWGTAVNPETKYLLLRHCFEDLGFGRVKIQTDALNHRSAAAIAKLGATREGVLRRHTRREDGSFRDSVVFSIIDTDWPRVREQLLGRINGPGEPFHIERATI